MRSLKFKYDAGSYYPLLDSSGLGFDVGIFGGVRLRRCEAGAGGTQSMSLYGYLAIRAGLPLDKLCRANTAELHRLECRVQRAGESITDNNTLTSRSWCTIS